MQMEKFVCGEVDLRAMKQKCVEYIQQFDSKNVLSEALMKRINLL